MTTVVCRMSIENIPILASSWRDTWNSWTLSLSVAFLGDSPLVFLEIEETCLSGPGLQFCSSGVFQWTLEINWILYLLNVTPSSHGVSPQSWSRLKACIYSGPGWVELSWIPWILFQLGNLVVAKSNHTNHHTALPTLRQSSSREREKKKGTSQHPYLPSEDLCHMPPHALSVASPLMHPNNCRSAASSSSSSSSRAPGGVVHPAGLYNCQVLFCMYRENDPLRFVSGKDAHV